MQIEQRWGRGSRGLLDLVVGIYKVKGFEFKPQRGMVVFRNLGNSIYPSLPVFFRRDI